MEQGKGGSVDDFSRSRLTISRFSHKQAANLLPSLEPSQLTSTDPSPTLGPGDDLKITIRSYEPSVNCEPGLEAAPSEDNCQAVLSIVPAYNKYMLFGNPRDWRTVPVRLPREFYVGECLMKADFRMTSPE